MGGIGNLRGAVLGGFIIGLISQFSDSRIPEGNIWQAAVVFAFLVIVMVFKPAGPARRRDARGRLTCPRSFAATRT